MPKVKIPITDIESNVVEVPDHEHLKKFQASTDYLHGDGFFPVFQDKLGKVEPGTGLTVLINDYFALIDGYKVAYRGIKELNWTKKITLDVSGIVGLGDRYIVLTVGKDERGKRENKEGNILITDVAPDESGVINLNGETAIPFAKINIPSGTTQVTADMIDNSVKKWLADVDKAIVALKDYVNKAVERAKREVYNFILGQYTDQIRDEIAQGDAAVRAELDARITNVQAQIDDLTVSVDQIRNSLADLQSYIEQQIQTLTTRTDELQAALDNLNNAVEENGTFIQQLSQEISEIEGDIVAIQNELQNHLQRIEVLENQNIVAVGKWEQANAINNAKNTFRISVLDQKFSSPLTNGFYDVFEDDSGIDTVNSSNYLIQNGYITVTKTLPENIIGYWPLDTGVGNIADDIGPKNNDGTIYGGQWVDGKYGKAIKLTYTNQYNSEVIAIPDNPNLWVGYGDLSWGMWIKPSYLGNFRLMVYLYAYSWNHRKVWLAMNQYGQVFAWITIDDYGENNDSVVTPENTITAGQWHHIVLTRTNQKDYKIYVNGVLQASKTVKGAVNLQSMVWPLTIGGHAWWGGPKNVFDGIIDEVFYLNRALTDDEVAQIYNNGFGSSPNSAVVQSKVHVTSIVPNTVLLIAEDTGTITYEVSRDGGTTWTTVTKNTETDISSQPTGTNIVLRATIPAGEKIDNWALLWS